MNFATVSVIVARKIVAVMNHFDANALAWRAGDAMFSIGDSVDAITSNADERRFLRAAITAETWDPLRVWASEVIRHDDEFAPL